MHYCGLSLISLLFSPYFQQSVSKLFPDCSVRSGNFTVYCGQQNKKKPRLFRAGKTDMFLLCIFSSADTEGGCRNYGNSSRNDN